MHGLTASSLGVPHAYAQDFSYLYLLSFETRSVIDILVTLTSAIALLVFIWGLAVFIFQAGSDESRARGRQLMFWGVLALFVLVSIWAIVTVVRSLFGIEANPDPYGPPEISMWGYPSVFGAESSGVLSECTGGGADERDMMVIPSQVVAARAGGYGVSPYEHGVYEGSYSLSYPPAGATELLVVNWTTGT